MSDWKRKDVWKRYGRDFMVEISRHEESADEHWESFCDAQGPHRWCVYAYIYPKHPHFANFDGDQMWQEAASCLPFHGGPSFLRYHYQADGAATSVQVGADYNHLHDSYYTRCATEKEAYTVFADAEDLFQRLSNMTIKEPA